MRNFKFSTVSVGSPLKYARIVTSRFSLWNWHPAHPTWSLSGLGHNLLCGSIDEVGHRFRQSERLRREDLRAEPIAQFEAWLDDAVRTQLTEPNAMSLATVGTAGQPLLRAVLLKGLDARGFVFFTNLESRKARHIAENSHVSLLFPWLPLERQVVVTGTATKLPATESLKYFRARPRDSQLAAWASHQSSVISSRKVLEMEWPASRRNSPRAKCRCSHSGAVSAFDRRLSNSGRADPTASTIAFNTHARPMTHG